MQRLDGATLYSATDLANFLECEHLTALDLAALADDALRAGKSARDESAELFAKKGDAHERAHLERLRAQGLSSRRHRRRRRQPRRQGGAHARRDAQPACRSSTRRRCATACSPATPTSCAASMARRRPSARGATRSPTPSWRARRRRSSWCSSPSTATCWRALKGRSRGECTSCSATTASAPTARPTTCATSARCSSASSPACRRFARVRDRRLSRALRALRAVRLARALRGAARRRRPPVPGRRYQTHAMDQVAGRGHRHHGAPRGLAFRRCGRPHPARHAGEAALAGRAAGRGAAHRPAQGDRARRPTPSGVAASIACRSPMRATCSSTWKATRSSDDGLEYLFGVASTDGGASRLHAASGRTAAARSGSPSSSSSTSSIGAASATPAPHVYHYAPYEQTRAEAPGGPARDARGRGRRAAAREASGRPVQGRARRHAHLASRATRSRRSSASTCRARAGEVTNAGCSIVDYERWRETGEARLLDDIEAYNRDDCRVDAAAARLAADACGRRTRCWKTVDPVQPATKRARAI